MRYNELQKISGAAADGKNQVMQEAHLPEPIFRKEGIFVVVLKRQQQRATKTTQKTTQKTEERILEILTINPGASRNELAVALGDLTEDGVKYQLNNLKKQGKIERIGPDKGGYWKINQ